MFRSANRCVSVILAGILLKTEGMVLYVILTIICNDAINFIKPITFYYMSFKVFFILLLIALKQTRS